MDNPNKLTIYISIITAATSIISIIISVLTLRQNSKMIKESTRPYVVIYGEQVNFGSPQFHLILKNFGKSGAKILNIESSKNLENYLIFDYLHPYKNISNFFIAPNQSIATALVTFDKKLEPLTFTISYSNNKNIYTDTFVVDLSVFIKNTITKSESKGIKNLKNISYAIQELVIRDL